MHRSVRTWVSQHQRLMCWRPRDDGMVWLDASVSEVTVWPWEKNWPNRLAKCHWDSLRLIQNHWYFWEAGLRPSQSPGPLRFLAYIDLVISYPWSLDLRRNQRIDQCSEYSDIFGVLACLDMPNMPSQFLCRSPLHSLLSLLQPEACLIALNVAWDLDGSLGFSNLDSRTMSVLGWICTAIAFFGGWIHTFSEAQP